MRKILIIITLFFFVFGSKAYAFEFNSPPKKIIIPSLDISLPVTTTKIINDTWDVSYSSASFGETTTIPGNLGNTVIFAHSMPHLFNDLPDIKKQDIIHVFTDKDWFKYKVVEIKIVEPEDINVLMKNGNYELTLYTCIGNNWEKRFIVKAILISSIFPQSF